MGHDSYRLRHLVTASRFSFTGLAFIKISLDLLQLLGSFTSNHHPLAAVEHGVFRTASGRHREGGRRVSSPAPPWPQCHHGVNSRSGHRGAQSPAPLLYFTSIPSMEHRLNPRGLQLISSPSSSPQLSRRGYSPRPNVDRRLVLGQTTSQARLHFAAPSSSGLLPGRG